MKCCGSPTTSTVLDAPGRAREVAAAFNALLFGEAFKPLAKAMGFYGDTVVGLVTQTMARRERSGLTDRLERAIEAASHQRAASTELAP